MRESTPQSKSTQQKRATIFRRLSSGIAVMLAAAVTASLINSAYSVPAPVQAAPYDGVTLYRGLYFASGPVASKIPSIRKVAPYLPAEYKKLEGQIIKYIRGKDPTYFDRFAKDIQSGDRVRVAEAIKRTSKLQQEAMLEVTKSSKTQFASQLRQIKDQRISSQPEPEAENDANVAVVIIVWVAVLVVVLWAKAPSTELKGLSFERYVDEIVRAVPKTRDVRPVVSP